MTTGTVYKEAVTGVASEIASVIVRKSIEYLNSLIQILSSLIRLYISALYLKMNI